MKDFVEGTIDVKEFRNEFYNNNIIRLALENDPLCPQGTHYLLPEDKNLIRYIESQNWESMRDQLIIFGEIKRFLLRYDYSFTPTKFYEERASFILDIQPSWLDILDEDFLEEKIISKVPNGLTKAKRITWCKERLKEMFLYDNKPPRWIQSAEWPIVNGKPLVFREQKRSKIETEHDERVDYVFYDSNTNEEKIITQWY